jgi:hypothetical protein
MRIPCEEDPCHSVVTDELRDTESICLDNYFILISNSLVDILECEHGSGIVNRSCCDCPSKAPAASATAFLLRPDNPGKE